MLPVRYAGWLPSSFAILLIGLNHMYRLSMLIRSFYSKTYISFLPVHMMTPSRPPLARLLVADVQELVGEVRDTWAACG